MPEETREVLNEPGKLPARTHVYRMNSWQYIVGIVFLIFSAALGAGIWYQVLTGERDANFMEMMAPVILCLAGALFTVRAFRSAVRFGPAGIQKYGLSGKSELPFERIAGRRRYLDEGGEDSPRIWHLVLEPNDDRFPKLDIEEVYRFDDNFYRWFNSLPDLDEGDKHRPKTSNFGLV